MFRFGLGVVVQSQVAENWLPHFFFLPKLFFHLISIGDGISFEKNSGSNFSVHPKGPKSKMAAKMAAVT